MDKGGTVKFPKRKYSLTFRVFDAIGGDQVLELDWVIEIPQSVSISSIVSSVESKLGRDFQKASLDSGVRGKVMIVAVEKIVPIG